MHALDYSSEAEILRAFATIPILAGIGLHEQHMLAHSCHVTHRNKDEVVIEQGEAGDSLYFILKGSVLVSRKTKSGFNVRLGVLGAGEVFGEIAILRHIPRTARISTLTPCTFLTISAADFLRLYQMFPAKSRDNIQLVVAKRLAQLIQ